MKKILIASDIHGSAYYCEKLLQRIEDENPERVILLGDILYHGPRNDLPRDYAPKKVIDMLNPMSDLLLCVRGNCDTEVDQMVLRFPIMADYGVFLLGNETIYATHGHHASEVSPPPLRRGDILLCGHTHIPACTRHDDFLYLNPGSVSIPKNGSRHSYMVWEDGEFSWRDAETGEIYHRGHDGEIK